MHYAYTSLLSVLLDGHYRIIMRYIKNISRKIRTNWMVMRQPEGILWKQGNKQTNKQTTTKKKESKT